MGQPHGGVGGVDALAAVAGGAHHVDAAVVQIDLDIYFLCLRHHCYGGGGGVDPSAGLGLRHTLHPVHAALVF